MKRDPNQPGVDPNLAFAFVALVLSLVLILMIVVAVILAVGGAVN